MKILLPLLEWHLPGPLRRRMLRRLVSLTAQAFGVRPPALHRLGKAEAAAAYARFTREQVDRALAADRSSEGVSARLHELSQRMGEDIRARLRTTRPGEMMRALRLLYDAIGIDFEGDPRTGSVTIRRCRFSDFYSPETCALMSAVDAGIAAGISGGGRLVFDERITEGAPCCRARLAWSEPFVTAAVVSRRRKRR